MLNHSIEGGFRLKNTIEQKINCQHSVNGDDEYQEFMKLKDNLTKFDDMADYLDQQSHIHSARSSKVASNSQAHLTETLASKGSVFKKNSTVERLYDTDHTK